MNPIALAALFGFDSGMLFARPLLLLAIPLTPLLVWGLTRLLKRRGTTIPRTALVLRSTVLALLLLSLAGPMLAQESTRVTTIFVLDRSDSVRGSAQDNANQWVVNAISHADTDQSVAIVGFGGDPTLLAAPGAATDLGSGWTTSNDIDTSTTDLSSALALARSLPVGESRRIVLASDGAENAGNALEQADQASSDGIAIDVLPLQGIDPADLRLDRLTGPTAIWTGDSLALQATISVGAGGTANVAISVDGQVTSTQQVALGPGTTTWTFTQDNLSPGFHAIQVQVTGSSEIDRIAENDTQAFGVVVRERPRVLLVAPEGSDVSRIQTALQSEGADVQSVIPGDVPSTPAELSVYQAIVLDNVPAWTLGQDQQQALVTNTRNGGGLIAIGGTASFGPGSYAGTTLEQALPVTVKVLDGRQRPKVALMIVMDTSGSMNYDPSASGTSKIDLAKQGVLTAASALAPGDQIGVIAFNDEPSWALPMTTLTGNGDQQHIAAAIDPLNASGGTEIYPALRLAYDSMRNVDADVRHIILLSDGRSQTGTTDSYERLVKDTGDDRITLSAVAVGSDADLDLLQTLAKTGGGRYHYASKPEEIPNITFQEAQSVGSQSVIRGAFTPIQQQPSTILDGISPSSIPTVDGYDFASGRPEAQVVLTSDRGDPLLTKWQLGLGRVVAFTGDDGSDLASAWAGWNDYASFWGNTLRWTLPDPDNQRPNVSITRDGNDGVIALDTTGMGASAAPDYTNATISVLMPDRTTVDATLIPAGVGQYEGRVANAQPGAYAIVLPGGDTTLATALGPSPEWQVSGSGDDLLRTIATRTGGNVLSLDTDPGAGIFAAPKGAAGVPGSIRPLWQWPLVAALAIYLIDIAWRLGFALPFRRLLPGTSTSDPSASGQ
ncbi:MAG: VWA domain-containing protein [Thermomicrobiales bacterium]